MCRKIKSYRAVNTVRLGYKRQPVSAVEVNLENSTKDRIRAVDGMYDFLMSDLLVHVTTGL
jgi:hypothetical protein